MWQVQVGHQEALIFEFKRDCDKSLVGDHAHASQKRLFHFSLEELFCQLFPHPHSQMQCIDRPFHQQREGFAEGTLQQVSPGPFGVAEEGLEDRVATFLGAHADDVSREEKVLLLGI